MSAPFDIHVDPALVWPTPLCKLMGQHGSDKGNATNTARHNYTRLYDAVLGPHRTEVTRLFELGVFQGASLRAWRDYFPNAIILGADIDPNAQVHEHRIETFICDETDDGQLETLWARVRGLSPGATRVPQCECGLKYHAALTNCDTERARRASAGALVDIIIDDGLHSPWPNALFMRHAWPQLRVGGVYVIEDILSESHKREILREYTPPDAEIRFVEMEHFPETVDNKLLVFRKGAA